MKQFSIFAAPFYSFFSRELFVDVGRRWGAKTFVYLLLVLALSWIPMMISMRSAWTEFLSGDAPAVTEQIPPITIENGHVSADVEQPHFIRTSEPDEVFAIIDTTGEITSLDGTTARMLLTESHLIARKNDNETRVYDLSAVQQFELDGPKVENWLRLFGTWGLILLYPLLVVGSYVYRIVQALFYSVFGLVFAKNMQSRLDYSGILRVTVVAVTPALVLKTLLGLGGASFPFSWVVYSLVAIGYVAFGVAANREELPHEG